MTEVPRVELGPGYSISRIVNGCWQLTPDHGGGPGSERDRLRIFGELVDHGFTTFDCADIYVGVEELLGRFRRTLAEPNGIQIHTKYAPDRNVLQALNDRDIDAAIDRSLRRLGVERIDLLQFHWWRYEVAGVERVISRLCRAQRAGKIRLLGVTNFNTGQLRKIVDSGANIATIQTQYSLLDRRPERRMTDLSRETGVRLLPYGVLAGGFLTDQYHARPSPDKMNRSLQKYRLIIDEAGGWRALQALLAVLSGIAGKHETSIGAVAARWVLDQPAVAAIVLGVGSRSRAPQNALLGTLQLDDEDRHRILTQLDSLIIPPGDMYDLERDSGGPHSKIIKTNLHEQTEPS